MRKAYRGFFDKLDRDHDGYISGKEAQEFFVKSNVPNDVLARIWAMADLDRDNRLDFNVFLVCFVVDLIRNFVLLFIWCKLHRLEEQFLHLFLLL